MTTNYEKLIRENLLRAYQKTETLLEEMLPAQREGRRLMFDAFGARCSLEPRGAVLSGKPDFGPHRVSSSPFTRPTRTWSR